MTELFISQVTHLESRHKLKALSLALTLLSAAMVTPAHALESISDAELSSATGEGIAYFANNFALQMPSIAGDNSVATPILGSFGACTNASGLTAACTSLGSATAVGDPGYYGSYIYLSPVGPVTGVGGGVANKTDVYLYGLSISQNDNLTTNATAVGGLDAGSVVVPNVASTGAAAHSKLFNAAGTGINWGTAADPFRLYVSSSSAVGLDGISTPTVPYLIIAAPKVVTKDSTSLSYSANNIRLGMWANFMQYSGNKATPNVNTDSADVSIPAAPAGPALQLQAIWDGFGINGTQFNVFPTPAFAGTNNTANCGSGATSLTCTLGLTGVLRMNSQNAGVLRLGVSQPGGIGKFDDYEGLYLQNLDINLPLGRLNFQPLVLSAVNNSATSANVTLELGRIPNASAAYNQFYINYGTTNPTDGGDSSSGGLKPSDQGVNAGICSSNFCADTASHGTIKAGDVYINDTAAAVQAPSGNWIYPGYADAQYTCGTGASCTAPSAATVAGLNVNGVTFKAPGAAGATVNVGSAAISGLMINHMKMTLTGL